MIITLKGANFSTNKIGTLSTWRISTILGNGATYSGVTSVDKDPVTGFNATVTIDEGYTVGTAGVTVTMGGEAIEAYSQSGNVITISIASVTGNVVIKVPTYKENIGTVLTPINIISGKYYNRSKTLTDHAGFSVYKYSVAGIGAIDVACTSGAVTVALWEINDGSTRFAFWGVAGEATRSLLVPEDAVAIAVSGETSDGCVVTTISVTGELILPPIEETSGYYIKTGTLENVQISNYVLFKFDVSKYDTVHLSIMLGAVSCACWTDATGNRYEIVNGADGAVDRDFLNSNNYPYLEFALATSNTNAGTIAVIGK